LTTDEASSICGPPKIKQVKLQQTTGEWLQIFELEVFDPMGTNVARGKMATASSTNSADEDPKRAVDGSLTTLFHSKRRASGDYNPWLNIDLGSSFEATQIVIYNRWCENASDKSRCLCRLSQANLLLYDDLGAVVSTFNLGNTCGKATLEYALDLKCTASSSKEWNQNWKVNFIEAFDGSLSELGNRWGQTCYTENKGFSPSFEDFARGLVIDDASDEDQCRKARELMGFDRDYPYDTEVRERFNDKACGIDHTAVDHMVKPLAKPPAFTEIDFEAPEYVTSFEMWSNF
jgi:hypothetical protein